MPARTQRGKTGPNRNRDLRYKLNSTAKGQEPAIECKACLRRVLVSHKAPRLHARKRTFAANVFSRIANKSPVRRMVEGAGLTGCTNYHKIFSSIAAAAR